MSLLSKHIAKSSPKELIAFTSLFREFVLDRESYLKKVRLLPQIFAGVFKEALEIGIMKKFAFMHLLMEYPGCKNSGVSKNVFQKLISNCIDSSIISELAQDNSSISISSEMITYYMILNVLEGAIAVDHAFNVEKFRSGMIKIVVEKDSMHIGSGFFVRDPRPERDDTYIVTARHNVDFKDGFIDSIEFEGGAKVDWTSGKWVHHDKLDISIMKFRSDNFLYLNARYSVLDEIITLGYPLVPNSPSPPLMVHRGEINGLTSSYLQPGNFILISNSVAPGSSGGPVMDQYGSVIGLVSSAFESDTSYGQISVQAALTSDQVIYFIIQSYE